MQKNTSFRKIDAEQIGQGGVNTQPEDQNRKTKRVKRFEFDENIQIRRIRPEKFNEKPKRENIELN